jgi:hypothetical protein
MCCYFTIYEARVPGNSEIYIEEFRKLINLDAIKPDNLLALIDEKYSVAYFMNIKQQVMSSAVESSGIKSASFGANMSTFLFAGAAILAGGFGLFLLSFLKGRFQAKIKAKVNGFTSAMFFNGQIGAQTVTYLKTSIAYSVILRGISFHNWQERRGEIWESLSPLLFLLGYPLLLVVVMRRYRENLHLPAWKKKIGAMYAGVHLTKNPYTIYHNPAYVSRRCMFALMPTFLATLGCNQL